MVSAVAFSSLQIRLVGLVYACCLRCGKRTSLQQHTCWHDSRRGACVPCSQPGTYRNNATWLTCQACADGTYTDYTGASESPVCCLLSMSPASRTWRAPDSCLPLVCADKRQALHAVNCEPVSWGGDLDSCPHWKLVGLLVPGRPGRQQCWHRVPAMVRKRAWLTCLVQVPLLVVSRRQPITIPVPLLCICGMQFAGLLAPWRRRLAHQQCLPAHPLW